MTVLVAAFMVINAANVVATFTAAVAAAAVVFAFVAKVAATFAATVTMPQ